MANTQDHIESQDPSKFLKLSRKDKSHDQYDENYNVDYSLMHFSQAEYRAFDGGVGSPRRRPLTKEQVEILEALFQVQPRPDNMTKLRIASQAKLTLPHVINWFQNRRAQAGLQVMQKDINLKIPVAEALEAGDTPDVVVLKSRGQEYKLHFIPSAINNGLLLVGELRKHAADRLETDPRRLRVLYEEEPLEGDLNPVTYYGVKQNSTVSCVLTEGNTSAIDSSSDENKTTSPLPLIISRAEDHVQDNPHVATAYVVRPIRVRRCRPGVEDALVKKKKTKRTDGHASRKPVLGAKEEGAAKKRRDTRIHTIRRLLSRSSSPSSDHEPLSPTSGDVSIGFPQVDVETETLATILPTQMLSSSPTPIANHADKCVEEIVSVDGTNEQTNFNDKAGVASIERRDGESACLVSTPSGKDFKFYEGFQSDLAPLEHLHLSIVRSDSSTEMSTIDSESERSFVTNTAATPRTMSIETEVLVNIVGEILGLRVLEGFLSTFPGTKSATADTSGIYGASQGNIATPVSKSRALQARAPTAKRPADSRDDSEDADEDDSRNSKRKRRKSASSESSKLLLACPYFKMDSVRYSERNLQEQCFRGCASKLLRSIPRLKQHLYRVHRRPEYYCGRCYVTFNTQALADTHSRKSQPCRVSEPRFLEKMDNDQMNAIKRRTRRANAPAEWYSIFKILFPDASLPASPYTDRGSVEAVQNLVSYFREQVPSILPDLIRNELMGQVSLDDRTQAILDVAFESAASQLVLRLEARLEDLDSFPEVGGRVTNSTTSLNHITPRSDAVDASDANQNMLGLGNTTDPNDLFLDIGSDSWLDLDFLE